MESGGGCRSPFFKLLFPLLQHGQLKQLEEGPESTLSLPCQCHLHPPERHTALHSGPCLSYPWAWRQTSAALPLWPRWTSQSEARVSGILDGRQTQAFPSQPRGRGQDQGSDLARAQMAPVDDPPCSSPRTQAGRPSPSPQHPALPGWSGSTRGFGEPGTSRPAVGGGKP